MPLVLNAVPIMKQSPPFAFLGTGVSLAHVGWTHSYLAVMDSKNTHLLLFSIVFLLLGFLLGRVTAPKHPHLHHGKHSAVKWTDGGGKAVHDVDFRIITDEDFEGDTVISLPGVGQVNVTRHGEEIAVEVETDEDQALSAAGRAVIVTKEFTVDTQ